MGGRTGTTNYQNDEVLLNYMREHAGTEIGTGTISRGTGLASNQISNALKRLALTDRHIAHPRFGYWLYRGQPPAPVQPSPVDHRIFDVDGVIAAVDRLAAAIKDQTDKFINEGIVMR